MQRLIRVWTKKIINHSYFFTGFLSDDIYFFYFFYTAWSNISQHILNSVMAIFEITLTNVGPMPWIDMLATVVILGCYLGVAYITHITQGIYSAYKNSPFSPSTFIEKT